MIIKYDNKAIKYTNKWISVDSQPTPPGPTPVEYVQIGNLLWQTVNTNIDVDTGIIVTEGQHYYNSEGIYNLSNQLTDGWRVPTYSDLYSLCEQYSRNPSPLCATSPDWSGTNTTGFTALPMGKYEGSLKYVGIWAYFIGAEGSVPDGINCTNLCFNTEFMQIEGYRGDSLYCPVRLCKNAT